METRRQVSVFSLQWGLDYRYSILGSLLKKTTVTQPTQQPERKQQEECVRIRNAIQMYFSREILWSVAYPGQTVLERYWQNFLITFPITMPATGMKELFAQVVWIWPFISTSGLFVDMCRYIYILQVILINDFQWLCKKNLNTDNNAKMHMAISDSQNGKKNTSKGWKDVVLFCFSQFHM